MTDMDELLDRVVAADLDAVRAGVRDLSETDRRPLAKSAIQLLKEVDDFKFKIIDISNPGATPVWPHPGERQRVIECAKVLVLATATASEIRKLGPWVIPYDQQLAAETLLNRSIDLAGFADAMADVAPFRLMHALVRAGRIERPAQPGYILRFIFGIEEEHYTNGIKDRDISIYDALKADPSLLEHEVWRLFEIEGGGETSLAAHDKYRPDDRGWAAALTRLSVEGRISRARLLDASLAALRRDFAAFRAGWFSRSHEQLQPTPAERRERVPGYIALISSPIPATVSFAIRALAQAGNIPAQEAERLRPALEAKAVTTVKVAVKLLPKSQQAARVVAAALSRAARGAQPLLLAFLERVGDLEADVRQLLAQAAPNIAPSFREPLQTLLGSQPLSDDPPSTTTSIPAPAAVTELAAPVESVPELIELLTALLERIEDPYDLERALDGVSRLCDRSDETLRQLQPLARRAQKLRPLRPDTKERGIDWAPIIASFHRTPRGDIADLVHAWAMGARPALPRLEVAGSSNVFPRIRTSVLGFLSYRVLEVAVRAAAGVRQPILSLPTARGGAIDPNVLKLRRREHARLGIRAGKADAIQAALRAGEIQLAKNLRFDYDAKMHSTTPWGAAYRHVQFHLHVKPPCEGELRLDRVPGLFLAALGPDPAVSPVRLLLHRRMEEAAYCGVDGDGPAGLPEAVRWVATVWPGSREVYYARGAIEIGENIDWSEARWHARHFLEPMLLPSEPIGEMARLLLALALGAKDAGERTLATDVLIAVISEKRLDCAALGSTLARLYCGQVPKANRLAAALTDAARVSRQHTDAVIMIIEFVLAGLQGRPPADLLALLSTLNDLLVTAGHGLRNTAARTYLSRLGGSSKAAALAKVLTARAAQ
jgi:hypothetical protein